jgi:hypothetical protein
MSEMMLPHPNESELKGFNKAKYFNRVYQTVNFETKYKITHKEFFTWIHNNFSNVANYNQALSYKQNKKLI